jgi:hypothetical protein
VLVRSEDRADLRRNPWFFQPDPEKPVFAAARAEKLVRRGAREYFMVGRRPDGREVEVRLTSGSFHMEGFF